MENTIERQFEEFKNKEGDLLTKLRQTGFITNSIKTDKIDTLEEFKQVIFDKECLSKEYLREQLKKIYKNHMTKQDISNLLKMGKDSFNELELLDTTRLLPVNEDGSISVDEFILFLFK